MTRLRVTCYLWPDPVIYLVETPRPKCPQCGGAGWWTDDYDDEVGECENAEYVNCGCWNPDRTRRLLPVPRWIARRWLGWTPPDYATEAPF
ncbi:hypothetical protein ACFWXO_40300 [Kitasatospora sp. NPDC059088]|uniref:hypothetical protein n=1 Tax=Kitasatospora sp. NPDC059088 TaxID=3346722 RepID=UPI003693E278